jgi:hypothetical protein
VAVVRPREIPLTSWTSSSFDNFLWLEIDLAALFLHFVLFLCDTAAARGVDAASSDACGGVAFIGSLPAVQSDPRLDPA